MKSVYIDDQIPDYKKEVLVNKIKIVHPKVELVASDSTADLIISPLVLIPSQIKSGRYLSPECLSQIIDIHQDPFFFLSDFKILKNLSLLNKRVSFIPSSQNKKCIGELSLRIKSMGGWVDDDKVDFFISLDEKPLTKQYPSPVVTSRWINDLYTQDYFISPTDYFLSFKSLPKSNIKDNSKTNKDTSKAKTKTSKSKSVASRKRESLKMVEISKFGGGVKAAFYNSPIPPPKALFKSNTSGETQLTPLDETEESKIHSEQTVKESSDIEEYLNLCRSVVNTDIPNLRQHADIEIPDLVSRTQHSPTDDSSDPIDYNNPNE